jgi:hypothetical protein
VLDQDVGLLHVHTTATQHQKPAIIQCACDELPFLSLETVADQATMGMLSTSRRGRVLKAQL